MTVTLAFKAFAKPIPCLTPFLATSDPSVLKRILAYIWGLPCSSNIFPKKVILIYRPIVAVRLRPISKLIRGSTSVRWWHFSDVAGLTEDVGSWGKADSQPTSRKRRD